jgi:hypothetical protein
MRFDAIAHAQRPAANHIAHANLLVLAGHLS